MGVRRTISPIVEQLEGYRQALRETRRGFDADLGLTENLRPGESGHAGAERVMTRFLSRGIPFSAVYAINDGIAMGAYHALRARGLRVPEDVSLMGSDDSPLSEHFEVPLTSMSLDKLQFGREAANLLLARMQDVGSDAVPRLPRTILLEPKLVRRCSVARCSKSHPAGFMIPHTRKKGVR